MIVALPTTLEPRAAIAAIALGGALLLLIGGAVVRRRRGPRRSHAADADGIYSLEGTLPVLGDLLEQLRHADRAYDWMLAHSLRFDGAPWRVRVPGRPEYVVVTRPGALAAITGTHLETFPKGPFFQELVRDMFGTGLVTADGAQWAHQRRTAARFFSAKVLRRIMSDHLQRSLAKLCRVLDSDARAGAPRDLRPLFMELTIETFAGLGLGVDLDCIGAREPHPFQAGLDACAPIICGRFMLPGWVWRTQRWLNVGPERVLARNMGIVLDWLRGVVRDSIARSLAKRQRQQQRQADGGPSNAHDDNDDHDDDPKSVIELIIDDSIAAGEDLEPEELVQLLLSVVIAARDTTAETMAWFFLALRDHPEVEQRLREELATKIPCRTTMTTTSTAANPQFLTAEDLRDCVYLEAAIKETIRLYPAIPVALRQATRDITVRDDDDAHGGPPMRLRKGTVVGLFAYGLARLPSVWGEDAATFRPERWLNDDPSSTTLRTEPSAKFFSFSAGPRICIGMPLALVELRVALANLLVRYRFELDPQNDGTYVFAPTLMMKHPLRAVVRQSASGVDEQCPH